MNHRSTEHIPVLLDEVLKQLDPQPGQVFVDGTAGGGGHLLAIAERLGPKGLALGVDRDPLAIERIEALDQELPIALECDSYARIPRILAGHDIQGLDGILLDLGLSSDQLAETDRGFSFNVDGPLDLRFNPQTGEPAWRMIDRMSAEHLANLIYEYGEERQSRRIARAIVKAREKAPIRTSQQLAEIIRKSAPSRSRNEKIDPATRTFQALRIAVNQELQELDAALKVLPDCLLPGGKLAIISFHSLEDRPVKQSFRDDLRLEVITRKPIRPGVEEIARNSRSRSAKLRVACRV
ncbi:MAG: 16S rRNA (cytosine(1402)-N(4))-methyltransferase [Planctomycetaceae bacterium]|nr:16S rRNA (cytosine(1402)-N(4))-methyltransferase [Planctomycetaceae bacterium]